MTPQLEKIARAIDSLLVQMDIRDHGGEPPLNWTPPEPDEPCPDAIALARAALSALLPPSEEMVEAMGPQITFDADVAINGDWRAEVRSAFTAAIQSILSEGEGT